MADATANLREVAPGQYELDLNLPRGEKGDPGGFVLGTDLGEQNLNTIITPGMYRQPNTARVTPLNNYPTTNMSGPGAAMIVTSINLAIVFQRLEFVGGASLRTVYERATGDGGASWTAWRTFASSRVDETAGRAIYTWDDKNNREQLIYGDTGDRIVTADLANGWTGGTLRLRRYGATVEVSLNYLNPAAATSEMFYVPPVGFRINQIGDRYLSNYDTPVRTDTANSGLAVLSSSYKSRVHWPSAYGVISYLTRDPWPTILPGTASGIINNT